MIVISKRILFTGGGSAGHVTVNIALIPTFKAMGWEISYIGSEKGIEAELVNKLDNVSYVGISTGKLRRYLDWENVKDPFRVIKGVFQAYRHIKAIKPDVVFSKGGFVSVPVIIGAWLNRVSVIIHESDITPGLANKISIPFASKICVTFRETLEHVGKSKAVYVGAIVREELLKGNSARGRNLCNFTRIKPVIVCMGGSLGSQRMNEMIRKNIHLLMQDYQIVHICGKGQLDPSYDKYREYKQFEYVHGELVDILAAADIVISRAGSNSIFEFLTLRKPMLLIPLSKAASRGDQVLNAQSFQTAGYCEILYEEEMNEQSFMAAVHHLYEQKNAIIDKMNIDGSNNAIEKVIELITT